MDQIHLIAKVKEMCSISTVYVTKRLKQEHIPVLKSHVPLFLLLPKNGDYLTFRELASKWNISKSSLSDILTKYEDLGFIQKCESTQDKRSIYICFTPEATPIIEKIENILNDLSNSLLTGLAADEKAIFENNLDKALTNLKNIL